MAGVYVHIPFCRKACHYCNFHFSTSLRLKNDFLEALLNEVELQKDYLTGESIKTIYFGGGTPSLLEKEECLSILNKIRSTHSVTNDAEITLEANPDDITPEKLLSWKEIGINRLSIGVQSFFDEDLIWMNRAHTSSQSISNLKLAREYFENITIDLIYGTPTLTDQKWKENVSRAVGLNIPHLSCYALTVEPKTLLHKLIAEKKITDINFNDQARQFLLLMDWMEAGGYEHYEISNFARPGKRSIHNSSYWKEERYLGLGPSAHSYNKQSRQWNISNNSLYIQSLQKKQLPFEMEWLSPAQLLNEYIMTSLRTMEGMNNNYIKDRFGSEQSLRIQQQAKKLINQDLLKQSENRFILSRKGKLLADGISAGFFSEI